MSSGLAALTSPRRKKERITEDRAKEEYLERARHIIQLLSVVVADALTTKVDFSHIQFWMGKRLAVGASGRIFPFW
jgi:hypothetical protein